MFKLESDHLKNHNLHPKQFLILTILFGILSVYISKNIFIKEYILETDTQQSFENIEPQLKKESVKASTSTNGVCGTPVVIFDGTENCQGGGTVNVDFGEKNGGRNTGTLVYSKDLSLKISKITIPNLLSGTDIPNSNIEIKKGQYILPAASSVFTDRNDSIGRYPGSTGTSGVVYENWATTGEVKFSETSDVSQKADVVVTEYAPSNTTACATCSNNSDNSEKIAKVVNDRETAPGHSTDVESQVSVLMCKDENSVSVDAKGVTCIDEEFSILKQVTAIFSGADWEQCNKIEYDENGNLISDGKCIDIEDVVLDLSGIFENSNFAYKRAVSDTKYPNSGYNGELSITFPAWVEIDGKGIYKVSAKITVPYEYIREFQESNDIVGGDTPSSNSYKAFIKYVESLDKDTVSF